MVPPQAIQQSCVRWSTHLFRYWLLMVSWWLPYLAKGPTPDFNNDPGNDFKSDVSKQIRLCTKVSPARTKHSCGVISLDMLTSLGQSTIRLRRYGWNTLKEGSLRRKTKRKKKNKVEEIQPTTLASLGSLPSNKNYIHVYMVKKRFLTEGQTSGINCPSISKKQH